MGGKGSSAPAVKPTPAPDIKALTPRPQESTATAAQQNRFEGNEPPSPQLLLGTADEEERRQKAVLLG